MPGKTKRDDELSKRPAISKRLLDVFRDVEKGFTDQRERSDMIKDNWDMYNCKLGPAQFFEGNSEIFAPFVHDAIEARKTRYINQIFPQSGRYVEATTEDGKVPSSEISLLEHYVRVSHLRDQVVPALLVAGDVEGQYTIYVDWVERTRNVTMRKEEAAVRSDGLDFDEMGKVSTVANEVITDAWPQAEVILDTDLLVLPDTSNSIEEALEVGGSVTVIRRWTKETLKAKAKEGVLAKDEADNLAKALSRRDVLGMRDTKKMLADAAGIKAGQGGKHALVYETWTRIKVDGELRLVRAFYGGEEQILGCKLCPYWNDRCPVISAPVDKAPGVFKGIPPMNAVRDLQLLANDTINEAAENGHFSAFPIVMTDPDKNPRVNSMVYGVSAIWETSPQDTSFAQFPDMWRSMMERVGEIKDQIFQTLGVNPSMLPGQTGGKKKRSQSEVAMEIQVDLLTTADAVTVLETSILSPYVMRSAELDHQFREDEVAVRSYGDLGRQLRTESVPLLQMDNYVSYQWYGVEASRNAAQMQNQTALLNVFKEVPPDKYPGFMIQLAPIMAAMTENALGPRMGPVTFVDQRHQQSVDPAEENDMMDHGFEVMVHPADDDMKHLQAHFADFKLGDPHGVKKLHIMAHQQQMQAKQQMAAQQQQAQGGGGGPAAGGQPAQGRGAKGPPGSMHADQMAGGGAPQVERKSVRAVG